MTRNADRQNVKPMCQFIAEMVMVLFCRFATIMTGQLSRIGQPSCLNFIIHFTDDLAIKRTKFLAFLYSAFAICLAFLTLKIALSCGLAFLTLQVTFPSSFAFFRLMIVLYMDSVSNLTFFALLIMLVSSFTFWTLSIFFATKFAPRLKSVSRFSIMVKFRNRFDFFALGTAFRYDFSSHNRLLDRRFWLEPFIRSVLMSGSLYFQPKSCPCQGQKKTI